MYVHNYIPKYIHTCDCNCILTFVFRKSDSYIFPKLVQIIFQSANEKSMFPTRHRYSMWSTDRRNCEPTNSDRLSPRFSETTNISATYCLAADTENKRYSISQIMEELHGPTIFKTQNTSTMCIWKVTS